MTSAYDDIESLSPSMACAAKTVYATFEILKESDGNLSSKDVMNKIPGKVNLTDWEKERYEKTGYIRWQSILHFYTIDCSKAGFLRKQKGVWYLTEEGENAISLGAVELLKTASRKYRKWDKSRKAENEVQSEEEIPEEKIQKATIEQLEENAIDGIKEYLKDRNPYEFQDLVAALLRAMGYYTPFISPKGKDGGIDVIAFQDPLGANAPRIKVQVKHRPDAAIPVDEIRGLLGLLNKDGDIGLFVTSGRFTADSERFARDSHIHVKLIDGDTFISLWKDFYSKLSDEEKILLPLQPIYFLGTNE
ncbi:MAG: Mrr restriction system protein [Pseudomonadota bacterium]